MQSPSPPQKKNGVISVSNRRQSPRQEQENVPVSVSRVQVQIKAHNRFIIFVCVCVCVSYFLREREREKGDVIKRDSLRPAAVSRVSFSCYEKMEKRIQFIHINRVRLSQRAVCLLHWTAFHCHDPSAAGPRTVASSPAATQTFCVVDFIFLFLIVHSSLRKVNFEWFETIYSCAHLGLPNCFTFSKERERHIWSFDILKNRERDLDEQAAEGHASFFQMSRDSLNPLGYAVWRTPPGDHTAQKRSCH